MLITSYLVISDRGSLRVVKTRPYLNNNEIALTLRIDVPDVFFDRLMPTAEIKLPDEAILGVDPDVAVNIAAAEVSQALKLDYIETVDGLKEMVIRSKEQQKD